MDFLIENWERVLVCFMIAEKIVKLSPVKWDDILVDGLKSVVMAVKAKNDIDKIKNKIL